MTTRAPRYDGWYYVVKSGTFCGFHEHEFKDTPPPQEEDCKFIGPFERFGMAKTDAIRLFEEEVNSIKLQIAVVRNSNEPGQKKPGRKTVSATTSVSPGSLSAASSAPQ